MELSVVILNYKVPYYLLQCLQSVQKAIENIDSEIIVIDNNSEDESCDLVRKNFPEVILIKNHENPGFSKANNQAVLLAKGKYICLLNPDTAVSKKTFENVLAFAEMHFDFGALGVKMIDGTGNFLPESKRNIPTPKVSFQKLIGNTKSYYNNNLDENQTGKTEILTGAFMFMLKSRYLEVGGLDEDYFMYGEDIDLSYKFLKSNYQNYYLGSETILHYKGESTVRDKQYRERFYGAMKIFYQKHFHKNQAMNFLVGLGVKLAKFSKSSRSITYTPYLTQKTIWVSEEKFPTKKIENSLVVFDAGKLPYSRIFEMMQTWKNKGNRFRIKPANRDFIIGSDSSDGRGTMRFL